MHLYRQRHAPLNGSLQTDDYICPFSPNAVGQFVTSCLPRVRLSSYEMVAAHADYLPALVFPACLENRECVDSKRSKLGSSCCQSLTERGSFCLTQATNKGVVAKVTKIFYYYYKSQRALPPYFSFFYTKRLCLHRFFVVMYIIPYSTLNRVHTSHLQKLEKHPTFNTSPSEISAATMRKQETDTDQSPTSFPASKPTMDRSLSSRYGNPLTFNVVVMFLFYVLSITLCLSSISTCVCVIFNPVGTLLTITGYLFYALVSSLLLTFLSIPLIALYFDNEAEHEGQGRASPVEAQETPRHRLITPDEFTADPAAYGEAVFIPSWKLVLCSKKGTAIEERIKKQFLETAEDAAGSQEHTTRTVIDAATHVEKAGPVQDDATRSTEHLTTREPRGIDEWMDRTKASATTNTDDAEESHSNKAHEAVRRRLHNDSRSSSEPPNIVRQDSDFQVALRGYMRKGSSDGGKDRRSRRSSSSFSSSASVGSCPES